MFKISRKTSVWLSLALAAFFMVALIAGAFIMPWLVNTLINLPDNSGVRQGITAGGRAFVLGLSYGLLAVCALADCLLIALLLRVRKGLVFTAQSAGLIRGVSWCGILLGLLFGALGFYFELSFALAFAGFFLGLCLRVVKNVIEEATAIKAENDLTV